MTFGFMFGLSIHSAVQAVPPPAAALTAASMGKAKARWVKHRVIPGELLSEVATRYRVSAEDLAKWNKINPKRNALRSGARLRILSTESPPRVMRIYHTVKDGESWLTIADLHGVPVEHLRKRWNANIKRLRVDDQVAVWVDKGTHNKASAAKGNTPEDKSVTHAAIARLATDSGDGAGDSGTTRGRSGISKRSSKTLVTTRADLASRPRGHERDGDPVLDEDDGDADYFPIMEVPLRSRSSGHPGAGRIMHGIQMPENEALYHLRDPERSYVSSHMAMILQNAMARFRLTTGYKGMVLIKDTSKKGGGPLFPHKSHQSGRDADIQLLLKGTTTLFTTDKVDWDANWELMHALLQSNRMRYIFLSWPQQRKLYRAAKRAGMKDDELEPLLEFPKRGRPSIIRHEPGHDTHMHIRVDCAPWEDRCIN